MPIYDRPTKALMKEYADGHIKPGQVFEKEPIVKWFAQHYGKIKPITIKLHVDGMSVNSPTRRHHPSVKPTSGHDLFFKLGRDQYRLWDRTSDPAPIYKADMQAGEPPPSGDDPAGVDDAIAVAGGGGEFALEAHLGDYLARNLTVIEPGLQVYGRKASAEWSSLSVGGSLTS
ncbi:MAG: hypothetical protein EXQ85_05225 [Alphaproteobacteria bacterium]|nr:hypothetical protein [Alphaproteobacteria bacterium]